MVHVGGFEEVFKMNDDWGRLKVFEYVRFNWKFLRQFPVGYFQKHHSEVCWHTEFFFLIILVSTQI